MARVGSSPSVPGVPGPPLLLLFVKLRQLTSDVLGNLIKLGLCDDGEEKAEDGIGMSSKLLRRLLVVARLLSEKRLCSLSPKGCTDEVLLSWLVLFPLGSASDSSTTRGAGSGKSSIGSVSVGSFDED